ncbi:HlyD family efflux transporter periplasmic adaptor subunit [Oceanobacter mangrovi]|uniref:HlyD family efflux transporter periplasmic adaptor subunit n=1 Tax=Oceanobacter mangrovi TaxID=2862510 RepID=UPI001C8DE1EC|nr:HlyD family efflux transporter periplasmic adaptor subunit [Oceanobacter mangrovi]
MKKPLIIIVLLAAALIGYLLYQQTRPQQDPDQLTLYGNVDVRQVSLSFEGSGRITQMLAEEGDQLHQGDVVAVLDTQPLELQAQEVTARIEAAQQGLLKLQNGARPQEIAQARSQLTAAKTQAQQSSRDYQRLQDIFKASKGTSVSQSDVDKAHSALLIAEAQANQSQQALELLLAGARAEDIAAAEAQLQVLQANLQLLQLQIQRGQLIAPADANIRSRLLEVGDMASPSRPVFTLALTNPKWIRVYVNETRLGRIHEGMKASISSDSQPDKPITGSLSYISSSAEFTPKAIQTEELRTSLVYEVRIRFDDPQGQLKLGQPVTVNIALNQ